ncbi:hypothetical protein OsI_23485 [Oryza sativa Indica Group]|uniref:Uncharacterized protein n=1 Tax=Oryza sativa subsp. indica TaxID=39946 RepID=A2YED6_ORYSI|nr:hypothetical protein OsI_23485 [Oryza sativa Indica Group]
MAIRKDNEPWQKFDADGPVLALVTHGPTLMENVEPLTTAVICRCSLRVVVHLAATTAIAITTGTAIAIATATTNNLCLRCTQHKQPVPLAAMHSNSINTHLAIPRFPDLLIPPNANKAVWVWGFAMREAGQAVQWGLVWIGYRVLQPSLRIGGGFSYISANAKG